MPARVCFSSRGAIAPSRRRETPVIYELFGHVGSFSKVPAFSEWTRCSSESVTNVSLSHSNHIILAEGVGGGVFPIAIRSNRELPFGLSPTNQHRVLISGPHLNGGPVPFRRGFTHVTVLRAPLRSDSLRLLILLLHGHKTLFKEPFSVLNSTFYHK